MTTKNKNKGQIANPDELITALYCRLSVEDMKDHDKKKGEIDESNSITNQKQILLDYAKKHSYKNTVFFVDDGISGTRFDREAFQRMQRMAENGEISRIIVKDLSRFGREQVEAGRPSQIARQLEKENILIPSAYYESVGRKHSQKIPLNPCAWDQKTIVHILENRQYTGCAINFKSTTVSYKVHKVIYNPIEEQQVIPNMQEPIIPEEDWLRVQELRKNKRRPTATGRQSLFSGLVFCPDCGAKLYFCSAKSLNTNQEFYCCSNYRSGRGTCKVHYIRNVVLEKIVMEAISDFADFVRCHEPVFLYMMAMKNKAIRKAEFKKMQETVEYGKRRLEELERLMDKLYEDNTFGRLSDDVYERRVSKYEKEQKELAITVSEAQAVLDKAEQKSLDLRLLLRTFREMTDIKELTPTLVNSLIERIEVHNNDKSSGHCYVKVDIYFTAVGMFKIPTEDEIIIMMEEIRKNPHEYRFAA